MTLCDQIKWACCTIKGARLAAVPPPGKRGAFERLEAPRSPAPSTHLYPTFLVSAHAPGLKSIKKVFTSVVGTCFITLGVLLLVLNPVGLLVNFVAFIRVVRLALLDARVGRPVLLAPV